MLEGKLSSLGDGFDVCTPLEQQQISFVNFTVVLFWDIETNNTPDTDAHQIFTCDNLAAHPMT
jgi:hypothetical protein